MLSLTERDYRVTELCQLFCQTVSISLLSSAVDRHGSLVWEMGTHDSLSRYLMFSLTPITTRLRIYIEAELIGGVETEIDFQELIRRAWKFDERRDLVAPRLLVTDGLADFWWSELTGLKQIL